MCHSLLSWGSGDQLHLPARHVRPELLHGRQLSGRSGQLRLKGAPTCVGFGPLRSAQFDIVAGVEKIRHLHIGLADSVTKLLLRRHTFPLSALEANDSCLDRLVRQPARRDLLNLSAGEDFLPFREEITDGFPRWSATTEHHCELISLFLSWCHKISPVA